MKKLSILFAFLIFALAGCSQDDKHHGSKHGGCSCCCGSGYGTGMSPSSSASTYRGFGQPTTIVTTPGPSAGAFVPLIIDPGLASGSSYQQVIYFNSNPEMLAYAGFKIYETIAGADIQLGSVGAGSSFIIPPFSGAARYFRIRVYRDTNVPTPFTSRIDFVNSLHHRDYDGYYVYGGDKAILSIH
jgi:hypothetical protein